MSGPTTNAEDQAAAAAMRAAAAASCSTGTGETSLYDTLESVDIDPNGSFKYVLLNVHAPEGSGERFLVRGRPYSYHKEVAADTVSQLKTSGLRYKILGGGRIQHNPSEKTIAIYGFSYGFPWEGAPRHDISAELVRSKYPDYSVTTSDEGY